MRAPQQELRGGVCYYFLNSDFFTSNGRFLTVSVNYHAQMFSNHFLIVVFYRPDSQRHLSVTAKLIRVWRSSDNSE